MKSISKLVILVILSQLVYGCDKQEPVEKPSEAAPAAEKADAGETPTAAVEESAPAQAASETAAGPAAEAPALPTAAPLKGLEWVKGSPVTFEKGKVYVVEFWATWCGPCKVSIPHLTEIQRTYKDKGVTVIGISNESPATIKPFVQKMGDQMAYTVAADIEGFVQQNYMQAFNKQGIPQAFIVNGDGKIAWEGHPLDGMDPVLDLVVKGDFDPVAYAKQKAEAEALQQQVMGWYMDYFRMVQAEGLTDKAKELSESFIEKAPADGLNAFAWNVLTVVKEADRDKPAALIAARKAVDMTESKDPSVLDTYALALFENGKIQEAVDAQQKAVDLLNDYPDAKKQMQQTLEKYQAALGEKI